MDFDAIDGLTEEDMLNYYSDLIEAEGASGVIGAQCCQGWNGVYTYQCSHSNDRQCYDAGFWYCGYCHCTGGIGSGGAGARAQCR